MNPAPARALAWAAAQLRSLRDLVRRHPVRAALVPPAALVLYVLVLVPFTPSISDLRKARTEEPSTVLAADGTVLAEFKRINREWVPLSRIAEPVIDALIATEDHRFYQHHGIDLRRTAGAALNTLRGRREGGSTLTQQLARNLYPNEIGRAPTLTRKVKEAITALKIEAIYSKDEILETYLNSVSFLYNAWGIEMAAKTYFDKSAKNLNKLEAATLVGMLKGTSFYNPVINPERAVQRRNTVLAMMAEETISTGRPPQRWRSAHCRRLSPPPTTCHSTEPAGLASPPSARIVAEKAREKKWVSSAIGTVSLTPYGDWPASGLVVATDRGEGWAFDVRDDVTDAPGEEVVHPRRDLCALDVEEVPGLHARPSVLPRSRRLTRAARRRASSSGRSICRAWKRATPSGAPSSARSSTRCSGARPRNARSPASTSTRRSRACTAARAAAPSSSARTRSSTPTAAGPRSTPRSPRTAWSTSRTAPSA